MIIPIPELWAVLADFLLHLHKIIFNKTSQAMIHKIQMEMKLLDPELQISAETLVKSLEGDKPWDAKINVIGDSSSTLDSLSFRACASGATTVAWWIWHSGGSAVSQNKNEETPLHAALDAGHLGTASALVLHMGANLFLPDKNGRAPIDLLPDGATREQLLKVSLLAFRHAFTETLIYCYM